MKTIVFYLSSHGFGHMARNLPIIQCLLKKGNVTLHIKCGKSQVDFARSVLGEQPNLCLYDLDTDVGYCNKPDSLQIDPDATGELVRGFLASWPRRIRVESQFIKWVHADKVVCDIVLWALAAAARAQIPSVVISNFTWVEIYQEYLPDAFIKPYLDCYRLADQAYFYAFYLPQMKNYMKKWKEVSLVSREVDRNRVHAIRAAHNQPIVYVSVGRFARYSCVIDVSDIPFDFFCTQGVELSGNNVFCIPPCADNTQDFISAADYVVTKAGFGTVAEALLAKKPLALLARDTVAEDRYTIGCLVGQGLALRIEEEELRNMAQVLKKLNEQRWGNYNQFQNHAGILADELYNLNERTHPSLFQ